MADERELFYGGAGGGGKSDYLLQRALLYVTEKRYAALLLRRTLVDLGQPGGLLFRAHEWLQPFVRSGEVHWDGQAHRFTWNETGASLSFGYMEHKRDVDRYSGGEYQFVGFDELTQFDEFQYLSIFRAQRRRRGIQIPIQTASASNPGGRGHEWVKRRFVKNRRRRDRIFIPAKLDDNYYIDKAEYLKGLEHLPPIMRQRIIRGDWEARDEGGIFHRDWFRRVDVAPTGFHGLVRYWDLAATPLTGNNDPSRTVGLLMGRRGDDFYILHVVRFCGTPGEVEDVIVQTAQADRAMWGHQVEIGMEQEPGSGGVNTIASYRSRLKGFRFKADKKDTNKIARAGVFSTQVEGKRVILVDGPWHEVYLDELEAFPEGAHDDQTDASSGAIVRLTSSTAQSLAVARSYLRQARTTRIVRRYEKTRY